MSNKQQQRASKVVRLSAQTLHAIDELFERHIAEIRDQLGEQYMQDHMSSTDSRLAFLMGYLRSVS